MKLALEPLHPLYAADRACVNTLEQALDICDRLDPRNQARSGSHSTFIMSGGTRSSWRGSHGPGPAPSRLSRLRLAGADARHPQRPRHDGRWRDRDPPHPRRARGARLCRICGGRDFSEDWWSRPIDEVLDACIARFRTVV